MRRQMALDQYWSCGHVSPVSFATSFDRRPSIRTTLSGVSGRSSTRTLMALTHDLHGESEELQVVCAGAGGSSWKAQRGVAATKERRFCPRKMCSVGKQHFFNGEQKRRAEVYRQSPGPDLSGVLSGFDRLVLRGTLRSIAYAGGMSQYLSSKHVLLKQFGSHVEQVSQHLKTTSLAKLWPSADRSVTCPQPRPARRRSLAKSRLKIGSPRVWCAC